MAIEAMENKGLGKVVFRLVSPPPHLFYRSKGASKRHGSEIGPFEPYEESLPLQSGWYSYLLDAEGRFRIRRGNTSSHAAMVGGKPVAGAGRFRVSRMGRVAEVYCKCLDYFMIITLPNERWVEYLINSFVGHPALEIHPLAVFHFRRGQVQVQVSLDWMGRAVDDVEARLATIDREGLGVDLTLAGPPTFDSYVPEAPVRLYGMHLDQSICDLDGEDGGFERKDPEPRLAPGVAISSGKLNFVIDGQGFLIVGPSGHQILSGGHPVAGAGHLLFEPDGGISNIDLNFSGHYRPPLTVEYVGYVYRVVSTHPLLTIKPGCGFAGRKFIDMESTSRLLRFSEADLRGENPNLEMEIDLHD